MLGGCNVHDGRSHIIEVLDQLLMHVGVIGHREARFHGVEIMSGLDLRCGQGHCCATADAVEGDLLGVRRDVVQAVDE